MYLKVAGQSQRLFSSSEGAQLFLVSMDVAWLPVWLVVAVCVQEQHWFCHTNDLGH